MTAAFSNLHRLPIRAAIFGVRSFYEVLQQKPRQDLSGPLLVVANHPNVSVDPVLLTDVVPRPLRFLAKSTMFDKPLTGAFLRQIGALPAYRAQDGQDTSKNADTFDAVSDALKAGDAVAIFPEGVSHNETGMVSLKSGAARMALRSAVGGAPPRILPVGLHYRDKERWRSQAVVRVGPTINVGQWLEDTNRTADPSDRDLVAELTGLIEQALRAVTVNAPSEQVLRSADRLAEATGRSTSQCVDELVSRETETSGFIDRFDDLISKMARIGGAPSDLTTDPPAKPNPGTVARAAAVSLVQAPAIALGTVAYAVPYRLTHTVYAAIGRRGNGGATNKIMSGLVLYPWWAVALVWILRRLGLGWFWSVVTMAGSWFAHLAARPLTEDLKQRWAQIAFAAQLHADPKKRARYDTLRQQFDELMSDEGSTVGG